MGASRAKVFSSRREPATSTFLRKTIGRTRAGVKPGADVDRASLDAALSSSGDVQSYEIQPDRLVVYLWPRAGGATFSFTLKPRFAMTAQSAESILYDYYNPDARASVPPSRFVVH